MLCIATVSNGYLLSNGRNILTRTAEIMTERSEELAKLAASEGGKPWKDTLVEVNRAIQGIHMAAEHIGSHQGEASAIARR